MIPTQAVILVGGAGTRLRPVTSRVPKPVAPLVERPFVAYILENLARHGVARAIFSSGHLAEVVEAEIGDGAAYGLRWTTWSRRSRSARPGPSPTAPGRSTRALSSSSTATC